MFEGFIKSGILGRALEQGTLEVHVHDLRDYTTDRHRQVDDRPYGGLEGMVLKPEPLFKAVEAIRGEGAAAGLASRTYLLSPQGLRFSSSQARDMAGIGQVILICGRYEGVDERVNAHLVDGEISIGDYVLSGGEAAAFVVVDAVARFVPGVVGKEESVQHDSFYAGLLDFPHYTRPREFRGLKVPEVLFSGNHAKIARWRLRKAMEKTIDKRPDLLDGLELTPEESDLMDDILDERKKT